VGFLLGSGRGAAQAPQAQFAGQGSHQRHPWIYPFDRGRQQRLQDWIQQGVVSTAIDKSIDPLLQQRLQVAFSRLSQSRLSSHPASMRGTNSGQACSQQ
jgi:hypothetical protein